MQKLVLNAYLLKTCKGFHFLIISTFYAEMLKESKLS